jgi:plastocyanin
MRMKTLCSTAAAFAAGMLVAAGISFPVLSTPAPNTKVEIDNFAFSPGRITVQAGTTVTWDNADDAPHTIASASKLFKSKALDSGDSFAFTFTTPGIYEYFCSLHPHMTGTVVVEATNDGNASQ